MEKLNAKVFNQLFNDWYQALCQFAFSYTRNEQLSEDLVQDVFAQLWISRESIHFQKKPENYLFAATRNAISAHFKKRSLDDEAARIALSEIEKSQEVEEEWISVQMKNRLRKAIDLLPKKTREVFLLHKSEGLTMSEIANYLGKSPKTIEKQIARAYDLLRRELGGN